MSDAGEVYTAFVEEELEQELARRDTLDARSASIVSTSGALATLLLAVGAFSRGTDLGKSPIDGPVLTLAILGLVAFVAAAALAIAGSRLIAYARPDEQSLAKIRTELWDHDAATARNVVTWYRARTIVTLREGNNSKAELVQLALISQAIAVITLASAVALAAARG